MVGHLLESPFVRNLKSEVSPTCDTDNDRYTTHVQAKRRVRLTRGPAFFACSWGSRTYGQNLRIHSRAFSAYCIVWHSYMIRAAVCLLSKMLTPSSASVCGYVLSAFLEVLEMLNVKRWRRLLKHALPPAKNLCCFFFLHAVRVLRIREIS